jgi:hypothetical protein
MRKGTSQQMPMKFIGSLGKTYTLTDWNLEEIDKFLDAQDLQKNF